VADCHSQIAVRQPSCRFLWVHLTDLFGHYLALRPMFCSCRIIRLGALRPPFPTPGAVIITVLYGTTSGSRPAPLHPLPRGHLDFSRTSSAQPPAVCRLHPPYHRYYMHSPQPVVPPITSCETPPPSKKNHKKNWNSEFCPRPLDSIPNGRTISRHPFVFFDVGWAKRPTVLSQVGLPASKREELFQSRVSGLHVVVYGVGAWQAH